MGRPGGSKRWPTHACRLPARAPLIPTCLTVSLSRRITGEVPGRGRRRGPRRPRPAPPRREVHFALESDGWNCTFECKMHVSASGVVRGGRRRGPRAPFARRGARPGRSPAHRHPRPVCGGGLSKSATKAPIEPERARRNVDIPHFSSRPIPARSAFVADLDTHPPRTRPRSPTSTTPRPPTRAIVTIRAPEPPALMRKDQYRGGQGVRRDGAGR